MIDRARTALILVASLFWPWSRTPAQTPDSLRRLLQTRVDDERAVGVILALVRPGAEPIVVAVGNERAGKQLDEQTVFEIGSITKAFTGILLADMVNRGEVRLDQPVAELLPSDVRMPTRNGKIITLQHLATHSSGLPRLPLLAPKDMANPYADYTVPQMYGFLKDVGLARDPGAAYEYSNLGVGLLGHVLALRAGNSYEALVRERILEPLGMRSTGITLTPEMRARIAQGHDETGKPVPLWDLPTFAGAGALRSTVADMRRFIAAAASPPDNALGRAITLSMQPRFTVDASLDVGLGWHRLSKGGDTIVWHNGGTGGFRAYMGFEPATGRGAVALSNTSTPRGVDDIGFQLIANR
jgi:D-alanyl-D-alanine-carboxypeptidase/D-alanyl-D-alanine-endopeptidase